MCQRARMRCPESSSSYVAGVILKEDADSDESESLFQMAVAGFSHGRSLRAGFWVVQR